MFEMTKIELELIPEPDIYIYSFRKVVEILIILIDTAKPIGFAVSIRNVRNLINIMTQNKNQNILHT